MKVTFFGIGNVGLVQAAVLADSGHEVVCVDIDNEKIENLKNGIIQNLHSNLRDNSHYYCNNALEHVLA